MDPGLTLPGLRYDAPLEPGTFLRRRKRFFADVLLPDGAEVVAHCANTGSMRGLDVPGAPCRVSRSDDPKRKLAWTLEQLFVDDTWVMVHTARPNRIVEAAILAGALSGLAGYARVLREQRYGLASRIDLLLRDDGDDARRCYVEVKNVTLVRDGVASFPDAVTTRGTRHLDELAGVVAEGHRAVLVLHVARADAASFEPADDIDPAWGDALRRAAAAGVEVLPVVCRPHVDRLVLNGVLPWRDRSSRG